MTKFIDRNAASHSTQYDAVGAKEDNIVGKKLQMERQAKKMTLDDLSAELEKYGISVQRGGINKWETGVTVPNSYQLLALCCALGIDEPVEVFTGREQLNATGKRKLAEYKRDLIDSGNYDPEPYISEITFIQMPISLLGASAGTGNFLDSDNFEMVSVPANAVPAEADFGVRVCGDSMEPVYSNGQTVWVKKCTQLQPGDVGIFVLDGDGYIKMYREQKPECIEDYTDSEGRVRMQPVLVSYNQKYRPIEVTQDRALHIVGKVL